MKKSLGAVVFICGAAFALMGFSNPVLESKAKDAAGEMSELGNPDSVKVRNVREGKAPGFVCGDVAFEAKAQTWIRSKFLPHGGWTGWVPFYMAREDMPMELQEPGARYDEYCGQ